MYRQLLNMSKLFLATLTFPALMAVVFYQYKTELLLIVKSKLIPGNPGYDLLIIIPSARGHFINRQAIRDTWLEQINKNKSLTERIKLKFVLGSSDCPWPPEERLDQYSCDHWLPNEVVEGHQYAAQVTPNPAIRNKFDRLYGLNYISFKVDYPVLLTKLGIHQQSAVEGTTVSLLDANSLKVIVQTKFYNSTDDEVLNGFIYKDVDNYMLPKDFEGIITGDNPASGNGQLPSPETFDHFAKLINSSLLHFYEYERPTVGHYEDVQRWRAARMPVVSFVYKVTEPDSLSRLIESSSKRRSQWNKKIADITSRIEKEQGRFRDLVIVDSVDTYRNITQKLLQAFVWAANTEHFHFLLKTDDDCFLNVAKIVEELSRLNQEGFTEKMWWGRFRHNWAVEAHGKWSEQKYPAPVYPQFACGAGYVLSKDVVSWLAGNVDHLYTYQGEDVSMGIWLAAIHPHYIDDPFWQCEPECISAMYAAPDLDPEELQQLWSYTEQCGDPCGCS